MAKRTINLDTKDIEVIIKGLQLQSFTGEDLKRAEPLIRKFKNNLKTIKVSSRKGKARNLQQFVCHEVSEMIGIPYDQSDDSCLIHSREMGQSGVDVILRGEAQELFPYRVESKNTESLNLLEAIQEAESNSEDPYDWMVVHKRKLLREPIVIISWSAFKSLFIRRGLKSRTK